MKVAGALELLQDVFADFGPWKRGVKVFSVHR